MTKIKVFFSKKSNTVIILIVAIALVAIIPLSIILNKPNKPIEVAQAPSSAPTSSEETSSIIVKVPDIVVEKPVSSETVSSKPNEIKVDGSPTSKAVEKPKPQPKVEKPKSEVSSSQTQPNDNDGIDPKIQKILDDAGFSGTDNLGECEGTTGQTKAGTDDGGYN